MLIIFDWEGTEYIVKRKGLWWRSINDKKKKYIEWKIATGNLEI